LTKSTEMLQFILNRKKNRKKNSLCYTEGQYLIIIDDSGFKDLLVFIHEVVSSWK